MYAQAGQQLGQNISGAIQSLLEGQKEQGTDQVLLDFYQKNGMLTPETLDKYQRGSHSAKTGIIAGLTRQFADQQQQAQEKRLADAQQQTAAYQNAMVAINQAQEKRMQDEANFTPRAVTIQAPPPGQTGIPYGPPTEAEAAAPKVTMVETSKGRFKEPEADSGAFSAGAPQEVRNPTTGEVEGFTVPTSKGQVAYQSTRTVPVYDPQGNYLGTRVHNAVIKPVTTEKAYTPGQINSAYKTFDVNASEIADSTKHHALNMHGEEVAADSPDVVAIGVDTERGRKTVPVDAFNNLKSYVTGPQTQTKRAPQAESSATPKPTAKSEVVRVTSDGRRAVFDADTKQFLRYVQ